MAEDNNGTVNLDLNLGPRDDGERGSEYYQNTTMNLEDWLDNPGYRVGNVVHQVDQRRRSRRRQVPVPAETHNLALELIGGVALETGEGSVGAEGRPSEVVKKCDNCNDGAEDGTLGNRDANKYNGDDGSFFDCHICLDLAKDPVVTCCGHLFCWLCIYKWLHHHSAAKECPVCKGEVTVKTVTPIYGRGNNNKLGVDANLKIPPRPVAKRVESWRQSIQRASFTIPMEEMIRRLGSSYDSIQDLAQMQSRDADAPGDSPERGSSLLNRILTSRAIRRERASTALTNVDVIDLTETGLTNDEGRDTQRLSSRSLHRSNSIRGTSLSSLTATLSPADNVLAERLIASYFRPNVLEGDQEFLPPVDDRDSVSSIAAIIHSESQTVDNAIEIDSTLSRSTLSSRRRSNVDSGDSRVTRRRRRLN